MKHLMLFVMLLLYPCSARDLGQWKNSDPAVRKWFKELMRPDFPTMSCCGDADGYWCDDIHVKDGHTFCAITDDRDDGPLGREHVPVGTVIEVPDVKLKWDRGNPTGHAVLFYRRASDTVFCFVQGGGT
jgi:hypothetical protein